MRKAKSGRDLSGSERGANLVEYALLVGLIALVCVVSLRIIGGSISNQFSVVASEI